MVQRDWRRKAEDRVPGPADTALPHRGEGQLERSVLAQQCGIEGTHQDARTSALGCARISSMTSFSFPHTSRNRHQPGLRARDRGTMCGAGLGDNPAHDGKRAHGTGGFEAIEVTGEPFGLSVSQRARRRRIRSRLPASREVARDRREAMP